MTLSLPKPEHYTPGHTPNSVEFMARRSAGSHAAFALPLFRAGMRILDCGCGPGSITQGIAERILPGEVIGIDQRHPESQQVAVRHANARFMQANVYELPFANAEFDGVFSHALFEHLARPQEALTELRRVMKPGAFIALRSPDWGGFVLDPWDDEIAAAIQLYTTLQLSNGGDIHAGRKLSSRLRSAGFHHVTPSASYEVYPSTALIAEFLAHQLTIKGHHAEAIHLRQWGQRPGALFAQAWFEAVGWKPWGMTTA